MEDDELENDLSNVLCAADALMAVFGLWRSNEIANGIANENTTETMDAYDELRKDEDDSHSL